MLTVFALYRAKRYLRWENLAASRLAGAVAAVGGVSTNWYALRALIRYYWRL
jgi:hypothetical protein